MPMGCVPQVTGYAKPFLIGCNCTFPGVDALICLPAAVRLGLKRRPAVLPA
ncbi:UNVERIFIED_CONTAM: hypothetical protein GTU68_009254 [Idotea baltica]|nr:hypothetical protein [Idotea baltica]